MVSIVSHSIIQAYTIDSPESSSNAVDKSPSESIEDLLCSIKVIQPNLFSLRATNLAATLP